MASALQAEPEIAAPRSDGTDSDQKERARAAGRLWAARPLGARLDVLRRLRHELAEHSAELLAALPQDLARTRADSQVAELLPLLDACRFLERSAATILRTRKLGRAGRPFWLAGVASQVERVPFGVVLVIAPGNYPLFLPGVQTLQALAAGNAVVWKPGRGGQDVAQVFAAAAVRAGLPADLLRITDESVDSALDEIGRGPDKIVFTGSREAGRAVLRLASENTIPVVAELSGSDAVFALPSADASRLVDALCFGMRLNGSATCMAPRRLILVGAGHAKLIARLRERFAAFDGILLREPVRQQLRLLLDAAAAAGATVCGDARNIFLRPILVLDGRAEMAIAQSDLFAPVLTVLEAADTRHAIRLERACPYGLTAAIFGDEREARALAAQLEVGSVLINDLIVPTADPRVPFGGRRGSGFGTTRGAEGLLEMTAARTVAVRRGGSRRHLQPTGVAHESLFGGVIRAGHGRTFFDRLRGMKDAARAARSIKDPASSPRTDSGEKR